MIGDALLGDWRGMRERALRACRLRITRWVALATDLVPWGVIAAIMALLPGLHELRIAERLSRGLPVPAEFTELSAVVGLDRCPSSRPRAKFGPMTRQ
jgi:hypothetical protein